MNKKLLKRNTKTVQKSLNWFQLGVFARLSFFIFTVVHLCSAHIIKSDSINLWKLTKPKKKCFVLPGFKIVGARLFKFWQFKFGQFKLDNSNSEQFKFRQLKFGTIQIWTTRIPTTEIPTIQIPTTQIPTTEIPTI